MLRSSLLRRASIGFAALVLIVTQLAGVASAASSCATGLSGLDCDALLNGTTEWVPDLCTGSGQLPSSVPSWGAQIFTEAANQYGVPPALVATIYFREHGAMSWEEPPPPYGNGTPYASSGQPPGAIWPDGVVGARGPFQFEPSTWSGYVNANPSHQIDPNNNQAVIQSVEDLTDAAFGAAKKLADLGGKVGNPEGTTANTLQPNTIVNAIRAYHEGAASTNPDLSYVGPAILEYNALQGNSSGSSCGTTTASPGNGVCRADITGSVQTVTSGPPICPWIPQGGFQAAKLYQAGQCTWWAAYNFSLNAGGNGGQWYADAVAKGMPTHPASDGPRVGELVSYSPRGGFSGSDSSDGHVAYIIGVDPDGQHYTVSEANVSGTTNGGPLRVDTRRLPTVDPDINGFIGPDPAAASWLSNNPGGG